MKSRIITIILALLVGGIGIHRFYLGQIKLGVIYLLLSWTLIPLVVSIIDCILFIIRGEEKFNSKYNS